ncbi:hypothetical protein JGS39_18510 [Streptomyces sp. P01-B04]|uniref:hypothetical protein n=2 Tax=Streptomyces TaxID=1883 RepID=UPI001C5E46F4|nr:hypothetical protein [Streptomyces poriferorum]MBW5250960.1 hypothetical protein [Streptomyces poriferorum]MBW5259406.1 hypothetical protein [Streptomyces poriferorum]
MLVVGFGCAGAAAAYESAAAGADVLVLQRAGGPGGSSALSGGRLVMEKLVAAAEDAGAAVQADTLATALIVDDSGRVVGVTARRHGREGYVSGTSLGDGTFFGRRAGVAAAAG